MKKSLLVLFVAFLFLCSNRVFSQVMLEEIPLEEQINHSSLVVEGKVISKKSFWLNNLIYTSHIVKVYKVFKGEPILTINIITKGGVVGTQNQLVFPNLKLNINDVGVFTLYDNDASSSSSLKNQTKQFKVYSSLQGFYKYNLASDLVVNPFKTRKGVASGFYDAISKITKSKYIEISTIDVKGITSKSSENNKTLAPSISNFTPTTVTAGTKMVMTINGSGFGDSKGKVGFSNADDGGATFTEALDSQVLTWTNNSITVEVPSEAGTGRIQVTDAASSSVFSTEDVTVTYSIINGLLENPENSGVFYAYPSRLVNNDGSGGYVWSMQTDFDEDVEHEGAKAAFINALDTWRCETSVNWTIGTVTTTDEVAFDGVNVVRFDNGNELPSGVLGQCTYYLSGCGNSLDDFAIYAEELDLVFKDNIDWYYGNDLPGTFQYDFQSVALHELGHGHQLGHVNDVSAHANNNGDVMFYAVFNREQQRVLHGNNIIAGDYIQTVNESSVPSLSCFSGTSAMSAYSCPLTVEEVPLKDAVRFYPNPTKGNIFISNKLQRNLIKAVVYDLSGRVISEYDISGTSETRTMRLIGLSSGVYLIRIYSDDAFVTKKFVLQ